MLAVLREEDSPPWLELPAPWYLPTFPPDHLAGGARELHGSTGEDTICLAINGLPFGGFAPCHCLRAVTTEQMMLSGVVADTQHVHSLACSPVVLQLGKDDFHGRGLREGTQCDVTPLGLPALSSPKS